MKYRLLSAAEVKAFSPPTWLAHTIVPDNSLTVLYGPSNIGKSFVALDLAHHVSQGSHFLNKRTKQGSVVYVVAGEGVSGLRARIEGWERFYEQTVERVVYGTEPVILTQAASVLRFRRVIEEYDPRLVVFDTLARCMAGADENSVQDMGLAIAACDDIRQETGAAVLLVHHTGRPDAEGRIHERGSTHLVSSADTMIEVWAKPGWEEDPTNTVRELRCRKQKDAEKFFPVPFELRKVRRAGKPLSLVPVAL